jgi:uncharacterized protein YfdQ (DUF2303 family)
MNEQEFLTGQTRDVAACLAAGTAIAGPQSPDTNPLSTPFVVVPNGYQVTDLSGLVGRLLEAPRRIKQAVTCFDVPSFITYVSRFLGAGTTLFSDIRQLRCLAILDYHGPSVPGVPEPHWCEHRATLQLRHTPEWLTWFNASGMAKTQTDFATFIEDNLPDIAEPAGATVLEIVRQLEVRKSVSFSGAVRLDNGQHQLSYQEDVQGSSAKGSLTIPETFTLGLEPFDGSAKYRITARLRYRMAEGKIALWIDLLRPQDVLDSAWEDVQKQIIAGTSLTPLAAAVA